jgi:hypothetical protein
MTYTVFDPQDTSRIYGRGLTAAPAMHEIMTYDGYRYEIRKTEYRDAEWFDQNTSSLPSNSPRRKAASAMIAKIPLPLSRHIARIYYPDHSQNP